MPQNHSGPCPRVSMSRTVTSRQDHVHHVNAKSGGLPSNSVIEMYLVGTQPLIRGVAFSLCINTVPKDVYLVTRLPTALFNIRHLRRT